MPKACEDCFCSSEVYPW